MKILFILFSSLLLIITGCGNKFENLNEVDNDSEQLQASTYKSPPKVTITNGEVEAKGVLGPYSWTYCCSNGNLTGIEASSDAPPNLVQNNEPLKVTSGTVVSIDFETAPIQYEVKTWDETNAVTGTYTEIDTLNHEGRTVFEILATWEQGKASYSFLLEIE
jgi:hypothetical protein